MINTTSKYDEKIQDEKQACFIFNMTDKEILLAIVNGKIDPVRFAKRELQNRSLDKNGEWVKPDESNKIWGMND